MRKTRINARDREALTEHAYKVIVCKPEAEAEAAALASLTALVGDALDRYYPLRDMKVLARYHVVGTPEHIELMSADSNGSVRRSRDFADRASNFANGQSYAHAAICDRDIVLPVPAGRMVPRAAQAGCGLGRIAVTDDAMRDGLIAAFYAWQDAFNALWNATRAKRADYRSLIEHANNYEDLIEVWPEAAEVQKAKRPSTALVAYDPALVERIKADVAARAGT